MKRAKEMGLDGIHSHKDKNGNTVFMRQTHKEYMDKKVKAEERSESAYKYEPKTGEVFTFKRGVYKKNGRILVPAKASPASGKT